MDEFLQTRTLRLIPYSVEKSIGMLLVFTISILGYWVVPFYPIALAIGLTIGWVAVSTKSPPIGLVGTLLTLGFAFAYQFGAILGGQMGLYVLLWMVVISALSFSNGAKSFRGLVGTGIGLITGLMMLIPYLFIFALPLMIITAFVYKGIGRFFVPFLYLAIHLPFLFLSHVRIFDQSENFVPTIYTHVNLDLNTTFRSVNPEYLLDFFFGTAVSTVSGDAFWIVMSHYFATNFVVTLLVVLLVSSISATYILDEVLLKLEKRGNKLGIARSVAMIPSNFLGLIVFFVPLLFLGSAIGYKTFTPTFGHISFVFLLAFAGGVTASFVSNYLYERQNLLDLRFSVESNGSMILKLTDDRLSSIRKIASVVQNIGLEDVKTEVEGIRENVELFLKAYAELSPKNLSEGVDFFQVLPDELEKYNKKIRDRLVDYFISFDQAYNDKVRVLDNMGFTLPPLIPEIKAQEVVKLSNENILTAYLEFQDEIGGVIRKVVSTAQGFKSVTENHMDPSFRLTTVDIAESFLEQKEYEKALETATEALSLMHSRYGRLGADMLRKAGDSLRSLRQNLEIYVRPFINELGHQKFFDEIQVMNDLDRVMKDYTISESVADIASLPYIKDQLNRLLLRTLTLLDKKLEELEYDVDERLPRDFNWGKSYQIHEMVSVAVKVLQEDAQRIGIESLESPEKCIKLIETLTSTLDSYLTMKEFSINYPNVESIILSRLQQMGSLRPTDLKVKHSDMYLKLYASKHREVVYDAETKTLISNRDLTLLRDNT